MANWFTDVAKVVKELSPTVCQLVTIVLRIATVPNPIFVHVIADIRQSSRMGYWWAVNRSVNPDVRPTAVVASGVNVNAT